MSWSCMEQIISQILLFSKAFSIKVFFNPLSPDPLTLPWPLFLGVWAFLIEIWMGQYKALWQHIQYIQWHSPVSDIKQVCHTWFWVPVFQLGLPIIDLYLLYSWRTSGTPHWLIKNGSAVHIIIVTSIIDLNLSTLSQLIPDHSTDENQHFHWRLNAKNSL